MGQFKPMVKMETTEPSVELKLKKGGKVVKKADGGMMGSPMSAAGPMPPAMPARGGMPMGRAPMKPSLAMRRRAMKGMPAGAGPAGPVGGAASMQPAMPAPSPMPAMKKGGKAEMESKAAHKGEMSKMKGLEKELKSHESKPASKGHKGLKTGGVVNGQGGFKTGGVVKGQGGYATGGVAKSNGGGYKHGGKVKGMMDGGMAGDGMMDGAYKKGGSAKKAYAAGGTVNSGRPVAMPQGRKKPSAPVSINELSGTFKKGGEVKKAEGGLTDASKGAYDKSIGPSDDDMAMAKSIRGFPGKVMGKVKSAAKDLFSSAPKADSVTKTKESVTVTPAKKRGGSVKC
jgi:hypothetical protein